MSLVLEETFLGEQRSESNASFTLDTHIPPSDQYLRRALIEVHNGYCFYTKSAISLEDFHVEHIHPRVKGGKDCIGNYVPASSSINAIKSANFDPISTPALVHINRVTFAPKVLRRYLELRSIQSKKSKVLATSRSNDVTIVRPPKIMGYSGGEYLERVIELSNTASSRTASPGRFIEEYTLYINKISNTVVSTIYALFQDLGLKREVYFTREGTQYHDNPDEARFYGSASIVQSFHIVEEDEVSDLELYVSFQRGEDFGPNSDCGKYMMNLKNQVLAVFALQDS